jgi:hypothetical protein
MVIESGRKRGRRTTMMPARPLDTHEVRLQEAVTELEATITQHYPGATFALSHPDDEPASVQLTAIIDVDDPDEVLDLIINRVVDLQVDEGLPIHVVPIRTPERVAAELQERRQMRNRS